MKIMVFDFGGGTLDVTIMEMWAEGGFEVLATSGDTQLGGTDMDNTFVNYIAEDFKKQSGIDLRTLQQNLGHSSIEVTAIYLTMDIDDRKEQYSKHPLPGMEGVPGSEESEAKASRPGDAVIVASSHTTSFVLSGDV
jgi:actin-like ATPase involved in cell morphogenesis